MLRSYWHYIIAVVGCLILAGLIGLALQPEQPHLTGDRGYQEQSASYRAGGAGCEPVALDEFPTGKRKRKEEACEEAQEQHREAADGLIEARRSADAADASAIAAYKQTGISGWGTGLGVVTMFAAIAAAIFAERAAHHTSRSANEAALGVIESAKSAKVAQDALALSEATAKRQLRAYISITKVIATIRGEAGLFGDVHYTNSGATPAKIIETRKIALVDAFPNRRIHETGPATEMHVNRKASLAGGQPDCISWNITKAQTDDAEADVRGKSIYIYGLIRYEDVFGDQHVTNFSYRSGSGAFLQEDNFTPQRYGNDAD